MLRPRWHKIMRDLWLNRTRTIVVVLSVAVGVCAIGRPAAKASKLVRRWAAEWLTRLRRPAAIVVGDDNLAGRTGAKDLALPAGNAKPRSDSP